jgi:hypothetical protein
VRIPKFVLPSLFAGAGLACTAMRTVDPVTFIPRNLPTRVGVWTAPDSLTIVTEPQIVGDSLTGLVFDDHWAVPLQGIVRVEAQAPEPGRTALLLTAGAASLAGLVYALAHAGAGASGLTPGLNCSSDYSNSTASGLAPCNEGDK